ncbi:MAG: valine--tRNA ligase [Clostridiaceae bacterium]|nr:valine--tRNA ligase [Clostridiaceae bacterium]HZW97722.1 valine--tRNA ligase [Bacillota bacterium]
MARIDKMPVTFAPAAKEDQIYEEWLQNNSFAAAPNAEKEPFCIVMPPPNITGVLHMGHALDTTLQDLLIRWRRLQGYEALWLPGTDHAAIATEAKIVESMREEGLTKEDLGREAFLARAWDWKDKYGGAITNQLTKLGASCDWERERFTLDENLSRAVLEVFVKLYDKGLIYRGERIINWCPHCLTTISDAEVEHEDLEGEFYYVRYPLTDGTADLMLATTRPETMLGDTAVAVHPDDERFHRYIGKTVRLPLTDRELPIIADRYVDRELGTGVVKITPAHDPNDFEVGERHNLPIINVLTEDAYMNEHAGIYEGMTALDARAKIVEDLQEGGYLVKTEKLTHAVGTCYRCATPVEPRISLQWFVKMKDLAKPAIEVVKNEEVKFVPKRFEKTYFNWMENTRDWCISRQLWWGHRIPVWYCDHCGKETISVNNPEHCAHCQSLDIHQDEDTLDTWFSSALWPFSTLGWPDQTEELDYFYPTDVLVTGYDIITFWVSRMIFSALEFTGQIPFDYVFVHGLVRDSQGRKMSKSLSNGIDPLEVIEEYGADALRYALISGSAPGNDQRFQDEKVEAGRNFINKIWNALRFVVLNFDEEMDFSSVDSTDFSIEDRWILAELNDTVRDVGRNLESFETGLALAKLYAFLWDLFCDWYIEIVKPRLQEKGKSRLAAQYVLNHTLLGTITMLHPFMPYVTEEMSKHLIHEPGQLIRSKWPLPNDAYDFNEDKKAMQILMDSVRSIRNIRAEYKVPQNQAIDLMVLSRDENVLTLFKDNAQLLERLARAGEIAFHSDKTEIPTDAVQIQFAGGEIFIALADLVNLEDEIERLNKEEKRLTDEISRASGKLKNENFVRKAPTHVVDQERAKIDKYEKMLTNVRSRRDSLQSAL